MDVVTGVAAGLILLVVGGLATRVLRRLHRLALDVRVEFDETAVWDLALPQHLSAEDLDALADLHTRQQHPWLRARGAVDHRTTEFRLIFDSDSDSQITVRQIRAHVLRRHPPINATLVTSPEAGWYSMTLLVFDLDQDVAPAWEGRLDGGMTRVGTRPYFDSHALTVAPHQSEHVLVRADVSESFVEWLLEADLQQGRWRRTVTVYRSGLEPFRTTHTRPRNYDQRWMTGVAAEEGGRLRPAQPELDGDP